MTDKIPESVMKEARDLFEDPHFRPYRNEYCIREVAKAILARDQRAAEIAQTEGVSPELNVFGGGPDWYKHGKRIARAILTYDEVQP